MSAYNIYKKPIYSDQQRLSSDNTHESCDLFTTKKQHLSSTGSSINVSPTSHSSLESSNNNNNQKKQLNEPEVHQVKPPETPRTKSAVSNYRKNLLFSTLSHRQQQQTSEEVVPQLGVNTKTDDLREFLEKKTQKKLGGNEANVLQKQASKPVVATVNKLDHFFTSTGSNNNR